MVYTDKKRTAVIQELVHASLYVSLGGFDYIFTDFRYFRFFVHPGTLSEYLEETFKVSRNLEKSAEISLNSRKIRRFFGIFRSASTGA